MSEKDDSSLTLADQTSAPSMAERVLTAFWGNVPKCDLMAVTKNDAVRGCSAYDEPETMCHCRRVMLANARAAISAMREPTEGMKRVHISASESDGEGNYDPSDEEKGDYWRNAIDAALSEDGAKP